jgi:hypothetical protein
LFYSVSGNANSMVVIDHRGTSIGYIEHNLLYSKKVAKVS